MHFSILLKYHSSNRSQFICQKGWLLFVLRLLNGGVHNTNDKNIKCNDENQSTSLVGSSVDIDLSLGDCGEKSVLKNKNTLTSITTDHCLKTKNKSHEEIERLDVIIDVNFDNTMRLLMTLLMHGMTQSEGWTMIYEAIALFPLAEKASGMYYKYIFTRFIHYSLFIYICIQKI